MPKLLLRVLVVLIGWAVLVTCSMLATANPSIVVPTIVAVVVTLLLGVVAWAVVR